MMKNSSAVFNFHGYMTFNKQQTILNIDNSFLCCSFKKSYNKLDDDTDYLYLVEYLLSLRRTKFKQWHNCNLFIFLALGKNPNHLKPMQMNRDDLLMIAVLLNLPIEIFARLWTQVD